MSDTVDPGERSAQAYREFIEADRHARRLARAIAKGPSPKWSKTTAEARMSSCRAALNRAIVAVHAARYVMEAASTLNEEALAEERRAKVAAIEEAKTSLARPKKAKG